MSGRRILVAASNGISSLSWLGRLLRESIPPDGRIHDFQGNHHLSLALDQLGVVVDRPASSATRRSDIRRALDGADHLLLFWDGRTLTQLLFEARLRELPTKVHVFPTTEVVNKDRGDEFDVYIGRGTLWGNPYVVGTQEGQFDRDAAVTLYRDHFENSVLADDGLRRGLLGLRGKRIACHCKPLSCHGDVIAGYLNSLDPDEVSPQP